jgi:hypothetical protein
MGFTVMHPVRGRLDATQEDLGCGWDWTSIHRSRPRVPLKCPECANSMHAKVSASGLRFFAHDRRTSDCHLAYETLEHHLLKLELATAVRAAGWHAVLESVNDERTWRADVLASAPDESARMAWEAQLSPITVEQIAARTEGFADDGVATCWVTTVDRLWLGTVPSILVDPPSERELPWEVRAGVSEFRDTWRARSAISLPQFVKAVLAMQLVLHDVPQPVNLSGSPRWWTKVWTTSADVDSAASYSDPVAELKARLAAADRERWATSRGVAPAQLDPAADPYTDPPANFVEQVREYLRVRDGATGRIEVGIRDQRWANGMPVYVDGELQGVACPRPNDASQWNSLRRLAVFVPENQLGWISRTAPLGTKLRIVRPET